MIPDKNFLSLFRKLIAAMKRVKWAIVCHAKLSDVRVIAHAKSPKMVLRMRS